MSDLESKIKEAVSKPQNTVELADADGVGTAGSPGCGDMLRMWVKYKDQDGKQIIDRATFQGFGCETALAVASVATELIRGKSPEEAMALSGGDLSAPLGALPPMKIHCATLVEDALKQALSKTPATCGALNLHPSSSQDSANSPTLLSTVSKASSPGKNIKFV